MIAMFALKIAQRPDAPTCDADRLPAARPALRREGLGRSYSAALFNPLNLFLGGEPSGDRGHIALESTGYEKIEQPGGRFSGISEIVDDTGRYSQESPRHAAPPAGAYEDSGTPSST